MDFDEGLLTEDSWVPDLGTNEYEVEKLLDVRTWKKTSYGPIQSDYLIKWKGYEERNWVDELGLNCGGLLNDFERQQKT